MTDRGRAYAGYSKGPAIGEALAGRRDESLTPPAFGLALVALAVRALGLLVFALAANIRLFFLRFVAVDVAVVLIAIFHFLSLFNVDRFEWTFHPTARGA